eukprot:6198314-Amphidinium_carterae.1
MSELAGAGRRISVRDQGLCAGTRVQVGGTLGTVRFVGETQFAPGVWVGVELDDNVGKNDGIIKDIRYFECKPTHGIFVRQAAVTVLASDSHATRLSVESAARGHENAQSTAQAVEGTDTVVDSELEQLGLELRE